MYLGGKEGSLLSPHRFLPAIDANLEAEYLKICAENKHLTTKLTLPLNCCGLVPKLSKAQQAPKLSLSWPANPARACRPSGWQISCKILYKYNKQARICSKTLLRGTNQYSSVTDLLSRGNRVNRHHNQISHQLHVWQRVSSQSALANRQILGSSD